MAIKEDLAAAVAKILRDTWTEREGRVVPSPADLGLGNDAVKLTGTVLYADMSGSTRLVDTESERFAAEIYRCYLTCAAKIIKARNGAITAYDGDRIMAVFIGDSKNTSAVKAAMQINGAVHDIVNPAIKTQYPQKAYALRHVVGVDTSSLFVARIGVRNDNDLVWVGRAANYAAKLSSINEPNTLFITHEVFRDMRDEVKISSSNRQLMWKPRTWTAMNGMSIHSSTWKMGCA
jgi:class 3 adenylate cyclase